MHINVPHAFSLQALVQKADKFGLLRGKEKELGWGAIRLFISLALLPEKLIEEGFEVISNIIFHNCKFLQPFINYYKDTWINGFKPGSFCAYKQTHRTNNVSERHNRELKENLKKHSTFIEFLGIFLVEFLNVTLYLQILFSKIFLLF